MRGDLKLCGPMYLIYFVTCMYTGQSNLLYDRCGERNLIVSVTSTCQAAKLPAVLSRHTLCLSAPLPKARLV